jgi:hypothetical protein
MEESTSTEHKLSIIVKDGSYLVDSRVFASRLGYEHKIVLQSIRRHKARLEAKSSLLQFEVVKKRETRGATREVYYLLDERQCLILAGCLKKGTEADEWHDHLVDVFLDARERAQELQRNLFTVQEHTFLKALRMRALVIDDHVADDEFAVLCEVARDGYRWEEMLNTRLGEDAKLERSVERCWWSYARTVLGLSTHVRRKRTRRLPDGRRVTVWVYPIEYLSELRRFISTIYFGGKFENYVRNRARRIAKQQRLKTRDNEQLLPPVIRGMDEVA